MRSWISVRVVAPGLEEGGNDGVARGSSRLDERPVRRRKEVLVGRTRRGAERFHKGIRREVKGVDAVFLESARGVVTPGARDSRDGEGDAGARQFCAGLHRVAGDAIGGSLCSCRDAAIRMNLSHPQANPSRIPSRGGRQQRAQRPVSGMSGGRKSGPAGDGVARALRSEREGLSGEGILERKSDGTCAKERQAQDLSPDRGPPAASVRNSGCLDFADPYPTGRTRWARPLTDVIIPRTFSLVSEWDFNPKHTDRV